MQHQGATVALQRCGDRLDLGRTHEWLWSCVERWPGNGTAPTVNSLLQVVVGCWICERSALVDQRDFRVPALAQLLFDRLDAGDYRDSSPLLACDPPLVLLAIGILRAIGRPHPAFESFAADVARTLDASGIPAGRDDLAELRYLVRLLDLSRAAPEDAASLELLSGVGQFQADTPAVLSILANLNAACGYGRDQRPRLAPGMDVRAALSIWMVDYLQLYRLETGSTILRTMNYLGFGHDSLGRAGLEFLLAQQNPDGSFGALALEAAKLRQAQPGCEPLWELYLPVTVAVLWTIAEALTDFRLVETLAEAMPSALEDTVTHE